MSERTKAQPQPTHEVVFLINAAHGCFLAGEKDDYSDGSKQQSKGSIIKPRDNLLSAMAAPPKAAVAVAESRAGKKSRSVVNDASSPRVIHAIIPDPVKGLNDKALYLTWKTRCSPKAVVAHRVALAPHRDKKVVLVGIGPGCENMIASYMGQYKDVNTGTMHSFREGPEATTKVGREAWAALPADDCITHWRGLYSKKSRTSASTSTVAGTTSGCVVGMIFMNPICAAYNSKTGETEDGSDRFPARFRSLPAGTPPVLILAGDKGKRNLASLDALRRCVVKAPCKGNVTMHIVEGSDNNPFDSTPVKDCKCKNFATQDIIRTFVNACLDAHGNGGGAALVVEVDSAATEASSAVKSSQGKKKCNVEVARKKAAATMEASAPAAALEIILSLSRSPSFDDLNVIAAVTALGPPLEPRLSTPEAEVAIGTTPVKRAPFLDVLLAPADAIAATTVMPALTVVDTDMDARMLPTDREPRRRDVPVVSSEEAAMPEAPSPIVTSEMSDEDTRFLAAETMIRMVGSPRVNTLSSPWVSCVPAATSLTSSTLQSTSPKSSSPQATCALRDAKSWAPVRAVDAKVLLPVWASPPTSSIRSKTTTFEDQQQSRASVEASAPLVATPAAAPTSAALSVGAGAAAAGSFFMMGNYMDAMGRLESTTSMTGPKGFTSHFAPPDSGYVLNAAPSFIGKEGSGMGMMGRGMMSPTSPSRFAFGSATSDFASTFKAPTSALASESASTPVSAPASKKRRYAAITTNGGH